MATNTTTTLPTTTETTTYSITSTSSQLSTTQATSTIVTTAIATPAESTSQPDPSFWATYRLYLLVGGAAALVAFIIILYLCRRRCRRQRSKQRLPTSTIEAAHLDDAVPLEPLNTAQGVIDSSPSHLQPNAVAAAPGAAFAHDVVPLSLAEPRVDVSEDVRAQPTGNPVPLIDQWAPAHDQGYIPPKGDLEELTTAVANNNSITIIPDTSIAVLSNIESGQFGHVHRASYTQHTHQAAPTPVNVRMLSIDARKQNDDVKLKLLQDALIRSQFCHPKLQALIGVVLPQDHGFPWLVLEQCVNGRLDRYLRRHRTKSDVLLRMTWDIAEGLHYLSCCNFVVGDLAAQHIMVSSDLTCKLSGLGLSRNMSDPDNTANTVRIRWAAPETLPDPDTVATAAWRRSGDSGVELSSKVLAALGSKSKAPGHFTSATDVWSFGIVLWELWHGGALPYDRMGERKLVLAVTQGYRPIMGTTCLPDVYKVMIECWNPDPHARPNFASLLPQLKEIVLPEDKPEHDPTLAQQLQNTYVTDADLLAATLAAKPLKGAKSPRVNRIKQATLASPSSSISGSAFSNAVLSSFDDSAVQSARLGHSQLPRDPSRSAPRRLAPVATSQPLGSRRPAANSVFSRLFDRPAQNFSNPARSLHALPIAKEAEEGYIDIVPSDAVDISRTFPRLKPTTTEHDTAQAQTYISALDARLDLEGVPDTSRPNSLLTRSDSNDDKEGQPTALALALQGATPQQAKAVAKSGSLSIRDPLKRTRQVAAFTSDSSTSPNLPSTRPPLSSSLSLPASHPAPAPAKARPAWMTSTQLASTAANPTPGAAPAWTHSVDETSTSPLGWNDPSPIPQEPFTDPTLSPRSTTSPFVTRTISQDNPNSSADAKRRLWTLQSRSQTSQDTVPLSTPLDTPSALTVRLRKTPSSQVSRANSEVVVDEAAMSAAELAPPGSELGLLDDVDHRRSRLLNQWSMDSEQSILTSRRSSQVTNPVTPLLNTGGGFVPETPEEFTGFVPEPAEQFAGFGDTLSPMTSPSKQAPKVVLSRPRAGSESPPPGVLPGSSFTMGDTAT
eukprot:m.249277 g.249277  ORF g.249277 m.249277 type:complete len:1064 (-) comp17512_c0_seq1:1601-4792(-)